MYHLYHCFISFFTYWVFWRGAVLGLHSCAGFSLVAGSRGYALVVVHRLLVDLASLVGAPGL